MPDQLSVPPAERYFEHYRPGAVFEFGSATVTEDSIVEFARQYDPQDMHTDREWAKRGPFGGLIASGWQTVGIMMRLFAEHYLPRGGLASPGIDELRWPHPVRPGDTLRVRVTVLEARLSRSKPDRGLVRNHVEVLNQNGDVVLSMKPMNLIRCRPESLASGR
jgi:acyl dehydratase